MDYPATPPVFNAATAGSMEGSMRCRALASLGVIPISWACLQVLNETERSRLRFAEHKEDGTTIEHSLVVEDVYAPGPSGSPVEEMRPPVLSTNAHRCSHLTAVRDGTEFEDTAAVIAYLDRMWSCTVTQEEARLIVAALRHFRAYLLVLAATKGPAAL